ncbi:hypothetical protein AB0I53_47480 [Saccharopolyspora sp. NPDC050389]|uniref:hypothetical protein n=1 Tax=Saccharopolyspora sp. NPDC050389 TaxID=3155516 RepID=UPI0033C095BF
MIISARLLGTAAALGVGVLAAGLATQPVAAAESTSEKPGSDGESGQGLSICRPLSLTGGQLTAECSVAPNGTSSNGSADADAKNHGEDEDDD